MFFIDYYYYMIVSRANLGYALSVELTCLPPFFTLSQVIIMILQQEPQISLSYNMASII